MNVPGCAFTLRIFPAGAESARLYSMPVVAEKDNRTTANFRRGEGCVLLI